MVTFVLKRSLIRSLSTVSLAEPNDFLLEEKIDGQWIRQIYERDWRDFRVGDVIDALDVTKKWSGACLFLLVELNCLCYFRYESTIRTVTESAVLVHYNNWESKWDEWIPKDDFTRLAKKVTPLFALFDVDS